MVESVLKQNSDKIRDSETGGVLSLDGEVDGVSYRVKIDNGRVVQFFPNPTGAN